MKSTTQIEVTTQDKSKLVSFNVMPDGQVFGYRGEKTNVAIKVSDKEFVMASSLVLQHWDKDIYSLHLPLAAKITIQLI